LMRTISPKGVSYACSLPMRARVTRTSTEL
jgi:hypothetical protein